MFGILADVRGDGCLFQPRGLPKNISPKLKGHMDRWLEHTPHWLTLEEWQKCMEKYDREWKQELKHTYKRHCKELEAGSMSQEDFDHHWKDDPEEPKKKKCDDIFYDWEKYPWKEWRHPGYCDIIPYINNFEEELKLDYIILEEEPPEYEFRLVFYFDS